MTGLQSRTTPTHFVSWKPKKEKLIQTPYSQNRRVYNQKKHEKKDKGNIEK